MGFFSNVLKDAQKNYKGTVGEMKVREKLNPLLFGKVEHRQINNLTLVDDNGKSHQIDHIEIRANGIFCIETKNYTGAIFGSENGDYWTQVLGGEKNRFLNPIKQNKSHLYHLQNVLGKGYRIHSVIVMVQNNADRVEVPYVLNLNDLKSYLSKFHDGTNYTTEEMDQIYQTLRDSDAKISKKEHLQNIKKTVAEVESGICPRCGKALVLRNGIHGSFYGCSGYPNCKFTKKN